MLILGLFCQSVEISGQKYYGFKNFQYFTKRTQIKKKGKKYIKSTIILKIEIFRKKIFFTPFSATFFQRYFWYLLPFFLWRVYFWHLCTLLQDFDPFWYVLLFISLFCQNFDQKKPSFFMTGISLKHEKRGKKGKKGYVMYFFWKYIVWALPTQNFMAVA